MSEARELLKNKKKDSDYPTDNEKALATRKSRAKRSLSPDFEEAVSPSSQSKRSKKTKINKVVTVPKLPEFTQKLGKELKKNFLNHVFVN